MQQLKQKFIFSRNIGHSNRLQRIPNAPSRYFRTTTRLPIRFANVDKIVVGVGWVPHPFVFFVFHVPQWRGIGRTFKFEHFGIAKVFLRIFGNRVSGVRQTFRDAIQQFRRHTFTCFFASTVAVLFICFYFMAVPSRFKVELARIGRKLSCNTERVGHGKRITGR